MKQETEVIKKEAVPKQQSKPLTRDRQRGISVVELLFAAATLGATILVAAMNSSKKPPASGD